MTPMGLVVQRRAETCFFERSPDLALGRKATVEGVGTLLLVLAAAGSGLTANSLFHDASFLARVANAVAIAGSLVGLVVAFGSVSGGHFNPLISALQWLTGERRFDCTVAYVAAQTAGGVAGALLANVIFGAQPSIAVPPSGTWRLVLSEVVATAALMIIVFGCARSGRKDAGPFAVGAWLTAAIIATPSASYANPAIALGALFADGPMALPATTVRLYLLAHLAGALLALPVIAIAYPRHRENAPPMAKYSIEAQAKEVAAQGTGSTPS